MEKPCVVLLMSAGIMVNVDFGVFTTFSERYAFKIFIPVVLASPNTALIHVQRGGGTCSIGLALVHSPLNSYLRLEAGPQQPRLG